MTEVVQLIDAGYGRSLRWLIGYVLDICLVSEENLSKWEGKMTSAERRIMVTKLISYAQEEIFQEENHAQRVGCF